MTSPGDALYRVVLAAFPRDFRARYGADMLAQFRAERVRLAGRPIALGALWIRAILDALWNGVQVRRAAAAARRPRRFPGGGVLQELRFAARGLRRDRAVTAVVVVTLTLGLGANAVMFGVIDQLLLRPPPGVVNAEQLRRVYFGSDRGGRAEAADHFSGPFVSALRDRVQAFSAASLIYPQKVTIGAGAEARQAALELVNASYFTLLELRPALGRFFTSAEDREQDAESLAVVSHAYWRRALGGQPDVVGQTLRIEGKPFTIVGVAPVEFAGLSAPAVDLWVPPASIGRELLGRQWGSPSRFGFQLVARLKPDATDALANEQATAALRFAIEDAARNGGPPFSAEFNAFVRPLNGLGNPSGVGNGAAVGLWLLGVAAVVLLVAMANVANVLIARTLARRREIAIRLAIGISRPRLLRQLLTESLLLTAIAGCVALMLSYAGGRYVQDVLLPGYLWADRLLDGRALVVTLGLIGLTTLGAGLAPAFYALRTDLVDPLRTATRTAVRGAAPLRTGLLVTQVTMSVVLLVGAGLFVRSLLAVRTHDVGMDLDRLVLARIPERSGSSIADVEQMHEQAITRLRAIPGVTSIALTRASAPMGMSSAMTVRREGQTIKDEGRPPLYSVVDPHYFDTVGANFERGRAFTAEDVRRDPLVVVINRAFKDERWPNEDPVGQCLYFGVGGGPCTRIVGVVENILHYDRVDTTRAHIYLPPAHPQMKGAPPRGLLIRTSGDARTPSSSDPRTARRRGGCRSSLRPTPRAGSSTCGSCRGRGVSEGVRPYSSASGHDSRRSEFS